MSDERIDAWIAAKGEEVRREALREFGAIQEDAVYALAAVGDLLATTARKMDRAGTKAPSSN